MWFFLIRDVKVETWFWMWFFLIRDVKVETAQNERNKKKLEVETIKN